MRSTLDSVRCGGIRVFPTAHGGNGHVDLTHATVG